MDFAMQALCPLEDVYDERSEPYNDPQHTGSWSSGFSSITGDRRSLSDASNLSRMPSSANSISSEAVTPSVPLADDPQHTTAKPKRRRENRYKNAPPAVISRRRAQNRASQRAYRERKDQRIRDLEELLEEAHRKEETLSQAFHTLQAEYDRLVAESQNQSGGGGHAGLEDTLGAFSDHSGMFACPDVSTGTGPDGSMAGFDFLDGAQSSDMLSGLYLQHDRSSYPQMI